MRRVPLFFASLVLAFPLIHSSGSWVQQPAQKKAQDKLPPTADFPAATPGCKRKDKLVAKVTGVAVNFPKTSECRLQIHRTCISEMKEYRSGERNVRPGVCDDYYAAAAALQGREMLRRESPR